MKTRVSLFIFCIQMIAVCGFAADRRIDGNGNPETREIKISDYDEITFVGSADFEYEQSDKAPYLSVTIDENLFDYLVTEVEGGTLKIYPKSIKKGFNNNSYDLKADRLQDKIQLQGTKRVEYGRFRQFHYQQTDESKPDGDQYGR